MFNPSNGVTVTPAFLVHPLAAGWKLDPDNTLDRKRERIPGRGSRVGVMPAQSA
jgi:hypothetical protein